MIKNIVKKFLELVSRISPEANSKMLYRMKTGEKLNLEKPVKFNEKLMWLKLNRYENDKLVAKCSDKYEVREYIKEKNCEKILNELYGVYEDANEIKWDELPERFVLKCTHGCQYNIICTDKSKLNIDKTKKILNKWLKEKYGYKYSELHYLNIKPKIICEKFLEGKNGELPEDYKVYCFNGKAKLILVCSEREGKEAKKDFFDIEWNRLDLREDVTESDTIIGRPDKLEEMLMCAEKLTEGLPFVRADFYIVNNQIYFGELTFSPAACCGKYNDSGDKMLSEMLEI